MIVALAIVMVSCAKAPPPEKFSYNEDINSTVQILTDYTHGTGFYLGDGLIMTAAHVVPDTLVLGMAIIQSPVYYYKENGDDTRKNLEVIWASEFLDVAICRTRHEHNLKPVKFADELPVHGDSIYSINNPRFILFGYFQGYVVSPITKYSSMYKGHMKKMWTGEIMSFSMSGSGGTSGAPIFNESGEVVGMYNAKLTDGDIGFGYNLNSLKTGLAEWRAFDGNSREADDTDTSQKTD